MVLYWGVRSAARSLPAERRAASGRLGTAASRFIPVLSDPLPEDHWPGRTGLVHKAVMADFSGSVRTIRSTLAADRR